LYVSLIHRGESDSKLPSNSRRENLRKGPSSEEAWQLQVLRKGLSAIGRNGVRVGFPQGGDTLGGDWWKDKLDVALPKIKTQVGAVFTDTVFIRSDSMKVRDSLVVSLAFLRDSNSAPLSVNDKVDTLGLGYKYKSRWVSSENYAPQTYYRQFPHDSLVYRMWNGRSGNCSVQFNKDSLYVVGGKLTVECKGKLKPILNINNSFRVNTDTLAANGRDTLQTKRILIDVDPANALFENALIRDRIRAVAWNEGAGTVPEPPQHPHSRLPWNHYWFDTHTPCENAGSTATGIMQIVRTWWWRYFSGLPPIPADTGYTRVTWDSLGWNWLVCIRNGKFIHDVYYANRYTTEQKLFADSCSFADCDTFPKTKNKEDLKTYAYHTNLREMQKIKTDSDWYNKIADTLSASEEAQYVRNVRKYTYRKPWQ
jgi:hypothetical protein